MNNRFLMMCLIFLAPAAFAQSARDSMINDLPLVNGKLIYSGSITAKNRKKNELDSIAKKWFKDYFKYHEPCVSTGDDNAANAIAERGLFEYYVKPRFYTLSTLFDAGATIRINCENEKCNYTISDIYFRRKSKALHFFSYDATPEQFIALYKENYFKLVMTTNLSRTMISEYLYRMNIAITDAITSLNKAIANQ